MAAVVRTLGSARGSNIGSAPGLTGLAPYGRVGAALALTPWLSARADLIGGAVLRRVVISVADETTDHTIATWGRPLASALVGLQAGWP